ncbi:MAG: SUMF1/EgtB/PvdO family nonheme iron enzyme, partial [Patescibacteria group bacterium]|nr:SUMF1/EgtB/PvdO family nonheme iron enzyme [Patescibacteria group bacterium]
VKAAYWNGTTLQTYATTDGSLPVVGVDSRYNQVAPFDGPWTVGSGTLELNGTYDMMGNIDEWVEDSYYGGYSASMGTSDSTGIRTLRGGGYQDDSSRLRSTGRYGRWPSTDLAFIGFRVASVPEPSGVAMLLAAVVPLLTCRRRIACPIGLCQPYCK